MAATAKTALFKVLLLRCDRCAADIESMAQAVDEHALYTGLVTMDAVDGFPPDSRQRQVPRDLDTAHPHADGIEDAPDPEAAGRRVLLDPQVPGIVDVHAQQVARRDFCRRLLVGLRVGVVDRVRARGADPGGQGDRKSIRLNSSHVENSYA